MDKRRGCFKREMNLLEQPFGAFFKEVDKECPCTLFRLRLDSRRLTSRLAVNKRNGGV